MHLESLRSRTPAVPPQDPHIVMDFSHDIINLSTRRERGGRKDQVKVRPILGDGILKQSSWRVRMNDGNLRSNDDISGQRCERGEGYRPHRGEHKMLVLAGPDILSRSSTTKRGTRGSTSLRGRAKSSTVSGTSKGLWKRKRGERSSACGQMEEKSTFLVNSTVIYNRWEFGLPKFYWAEAACPSSTGPRQ